MKPRRLSLLAAAVVIGCAALAGCANAGGASDGRQDVIAAFYPLQFVAEQVGGSHVRVDNLVKPGAEPHDLELSPRQMGAVGSADLVLYLKRFQPAVDEAVSAAAPDKSLDVSGVEPLKDGYVPLEEGTLREDEKGQDPHVWLDPVRLAAISDAVAKKLGRSDAEHAGEYTANAKALRTKLEALDAEYRAGLAKCQQKSIVVSHNAFGYLAARYGFEQRALAGLTPDAEPSAAKLRDLAEFARTHDVKVIFFETLVSPKLAETLAAEIGAKTDVLDPLEGLKEGSGDDYLSVMRRNLTKLRAALDCS